MHFLSVVYLIWLREILRQWRDRVRIFASFAMPFLFLLVMGRGISAGLSAFGVAPSFDYLQFIFPGIIGMTVMMTAIYQSISVVYDREFGFLKEMLVAPIPRWTIVFGKVLGLATLGLFQGFIVLMLAPLAGISLSGELILKALPVLMLLALSISSFGVALASRVKTIQGFQAIVPLPIVLMTFLAGTMYPLKNLPMDLEILAKIDPLTYGIDLLRQIFLSGTMSDELISQVTLFPWQLDLGVIIGFTLFMLAFASFTFRED